MKSFFLKFFLLFLLVTSCKTNYWKKENISSNSLKIDYTLASNPEIDQYISPYRKKIENDLNKILAYNVSDLEKKADDLNTALGNLMGDAGFEQADSVFYKKTGKHIDFALFNWGGIRSSLPKGNITTRSAFNLMPFENKLMVVSLKGSEIFELANYLIEAKTPHPLSKEMELLINEDNSIRKIQIKGKNIDKEASYWVCTTDYLFNGGDRMYFFKKNTSSLDLEYTFRNALIDFFNKKDTIFSKKDHRLKKITNE